MATTRLALGSPLLAAFSLTLLFGACSSDSGRVADANAGGEFFVVRTEPTNGASIFLNDAVRVYFSSPIDLDSASSTTVAFEELDDAGNPTGVPVTGTYDASSDGMQLLFVPRLPSNDDFTDGGFRPGRRYLARLVGGSADDGTTLRDRSGQGLEAPFAFEFRTNAGSEPPELFRNPKVGGPARAGFAVSSASDLQAVPLGLFGAPALEVRLVFDQALNPRRVNLPVAIETDPLRRDESQRGRIFLEYQDPELDPGPDDFTWLPADVELERNDLDGATLVLRPIGVLPNNAVVRTIVEATVEDIAGESNVGASSYDRIFATFKTAAAYEQQWNGIVERFDGDSARDPGAVFVEAQAEVGQGWLRAGFDFNGVTTTRDYRPTSIEVLLNTAFTQIVPEEGLPFSVNGGVFQFRNVTIPQGITVIGQGPNPMVWLVSGQFRVDGTLSVRGGDGQRVNTLQSANIAKAGGVGACGGGNGGDGTPNATKRDRRGGAGRGAFQAAGKGGQGGYFGCRGSCFTGTGITGGSGGGSGGGGGTLATQGDPHYRGTTPNNIQPNVPPTANTAFQQVRGFGGPGCSGGSGTRSEFLRGGEPGEPVFTDSRSDNDFWGSAIDLARNLRIAGELDVPKGGGGGGGGGDTQSIEDPVCSAEPANATLDYSGGGGGGGGGVLIVKALGEILVSSTGRILADGGHGGGGEQGGTCGRGGGGGGGSGGMVVLMSARGIRFEAHGNPIQNRFVYGDGSNGPLAGNDYSFAVSADGGVCTTGGFAGTVGGTVITGKYPASGQPLMAGSLYDADPVGGLGGMGIVQLMAPPGDNADGTNTILDDNVHFHRPGGLASEPPSLLMNAAEKQQLLAWRGFPNAAGELVDDFGVATAIGANEGDIRPAPVLLPVPFAAKSRARSRWLDTGRSERRELAAPDGLPRGLVVGNGAEVGPRFEFPAPGPDGYIAWQPINNTGVRVVTPVVVPATAIAAVDTGASHLGSAAYRVRLSDAVLGAIADRFVQYEAEVQNTAGSDLGSFRIVHHTADELWLDPDREPLPVDAARVQVSAKLFGVRTRDNDGLPHRVPLGATTAVPSANVRIGFAFHTNPNLATPLVGRFPDSSEQAFVYDLAAPDVQAWLAANHPRYVQWDVIFDLTYDAGAGAQTLRADQARPELFFLRLPFSF